MHITCYPYFDPYFDILALFNNSNSDLEMLSFYPETSIHSSLISFSFLLDTLMFKIK